MRILVTGGAGFIGSHLCEGLIADGHQVGILDDLNDFYEPALKLANLEWIRRRGEFEFHRCDITDTVHVSELVGQMKPEAIMHMAARAGVRPSLAQPLLYERVNVQGTIGLLEAARKTGVKRFVFASSSSIYGIASKVPFREDDCDNMPISPYAATKLAAERICYVYSHLYEMSIVCLRFFTVYGPRQRPDLAIRKFIGMIDEGRPIPVFGDGSSGRDYTFIDDIVAGILSALHYATRFDVFNLGNSHPVDLNKMIATIEAALGKKAQRQVMPQQPGDVPITFADISKAQRELGYQPATSFAAGIEKVVEWHRIARLREQPDQVRPNQAG
jgi:UDP-glucuronate 4-epimerase